MSFSQHSMADQSLPKVPKKMEHVKQTPLYKYSERNPELMRDFAKSSRVVPFPNGKGEIVGIKFVTVTKDSKWEAWGIKSGQVVTSIFDEPITSLMDLVNVYNKYEKTDRVTFGFQGEATR